MRLGSAILVIGASAFAFSGRAEAEFVDLIANGGFETGDSAGWTIASLDDSGGLTGGFFVSTPGTPTPLTNLPTQGNPQGGSFYAVSDEVGPGIHVLSQTFLVPEHLAPVRLLFDMFVNNWGEGPFIDQQVRVDILAGGASPFSTDPADILRNFYLGVDPGGFAANPHPFTSYDFDIRGLLAPGATGQVRFFETDNQYFLNNGVDNLRILAVPVPEPSSLVLGCAGSICMAIAAARRKWQGRE
jgi:hypothetical protein